VKLFLLRFIFSFKDKGNEILFFYGFDVLNTPPKHKKETQKE